MTEVGIGYEEDLERVEKLIADEYIPNFKSKYKDLLEGDVLYLGVSALADSSVNLKLASKVQESNLPKVSR